MGAKLEGAKFELGRTVVTRGISAMMEAGPLLSVDVGRIIHRHVTGDWGNLGAEDKRMNDEAVKTGEDRILSKYVLSGQDVYVITEWDRSVTTILLCEEY